MKQWLLMLLSITLLGCSTAPQPQINFYLLPHSSTLNHTTHTPPSTLLIVQPVELAAYLDKAGIIYRQS
ncbi:MAG: PqiC family protein, partial [Vibrio sp.]